MNGLKWLLLHGELTFRRLFTKAGLWMEYHRVRGTTPYVQYIIVTSIGQNGIQDGFILLHGMLRFLAVEFQ